MSSQVTPPLLANTVPSLDDDLDVFDDAVNSERQGRQDPLVVLPLVSLDVRPIASRPCTIVLVFPASSSRTSSLSSLSSLLCPKPKVPLEQALRVHNCGSG